MLPEINLKAGPQVLRGMPGDGRLAADPGIQPVNFADLLGGSVQAVADRAPSVTGDPARAGGNRLPDSGRPLPFIDEATAADDSSLDLAVPVIHERSPEPSAPAGTGFSPHFSPGGAGLPVPGDLPSAEFSPLPAGAARVARAAADAISLAAAPVSVPVEPGEMSATPPVMPAIPPSGPVAGVPNDVAVTGRLPALPGERIGARSMTTAEVMPRAPRAAGVRESAETAYLAAGSHRPVAAVAESRPSGEWTDAMQKFSEDGQAAVRLQAGVAAMSPSGPEFDPVLVPESTAVQRSPGGSGTAASAQPLQGQPINLPVSEAGWDTALSERVLLMTNNRLQNARIQLSPAELGPVRVELTVDDNTASVTFHAPHAMTREAIEQALPRLREMLAESGLQLGRCDVNDSGAQDRAGDRQSRDTVPSARSGHDPDADLEPQTVTDVAVRPSTGLVDTFA